MKVVFISSLERSGSTILDLKLSNLPNTVSFGEVWRAIKPHGADLDSVRQRLCTCGKSGGSCEIWSVVFDRIEERQARTLAQCYEVFLDVVRENYGNDVIVIDSSKSIQSLDALRQARNADVHVVFTMRDVRGWMNSIRKAEKLKRELPWGKIFEPDFRFFWLSYIRHNILRSIPLWLPHEWMLRNLRLLRKIRKSTFPWLKISYEELVFYPDKTVIRIEQFLKSESETNRLPGNSQALHIIRGNRTAFQSSPKDPLKYDSAWMSKWQSSLVLALLPWIAQFNKKWVYDYLNTRREKNLPNKAVTQ
jgi:hypothetical protein